MIVTAALEAADINVITVDWGAVAESINYNLARLGVAPVGEYTGQLVDFLVDMVGVSADDIHLVGHSLGAHVCGVTGESVTFGQLSRITGKFAQFLQPYELLNNFKSIPTLVTSPPLLLNYPLNTTQIIFLYTYSKVHQI